MLNGKLLRTMLLVYALWLTLWSVVLKIGVSKDQIFEPVIYLHLFSYLLALYFINNIRTIKKTLVFCVGIPLLCCAITGITFLFTRVADWNFPSNLDASRTVFFILDIFGIFFYGLLGWYIAFPLLAIGLLNLHLSKNAEGSLLYKKLKFYSIFNTTRREKKSYLVMIFLYIIATFCYYYFLSIFDSVAKNSNLIYINPMRKTTVFAEGVLIYIPSFFAMCCLNFKTIKRVIIGNVLFPLFWSLVMRVVYAMMIFISMLSSWDFFRKDILTLDFYIDSYIKTRAWFISILLILVSLIYYYLNLRFKTPPPSSLPPANPSPTYPPASTLLCSSLERYPDEGQK